MKRASYRKAIQWIADNDEQGDAADFREVEVAETVTALLIADIFQVSSDRVADDIVRSRVRRIDKERE